MSVGSRGETIEDSTDAIAMLRVNIRMDQRAELNFKLSRRRYLVGVASVAVMAVVFLSVGWPETAVLAFLVVAILLLQLLDAHEMLRSVRERLRMRLSVLLEAESHPNASSS